MTEPSKDQEEVVDTVYRFAADLMDQGLSSDKIKNRLVAEGLNEDSAAAVVANLRKARRQAMRDAGARKMAIGIAVCAIGAVVTYFTYTAATASPTGGSYVVAWGAILFGGLQFLRGLYQWITN